MSIYQYLFNPSLQVFKYVRYAWAEVEHIERQHRFALAANRY